MTGNKRFKPQIPNFSAIKANFSLIKAVINYSCNFPFSTVLQLSKAVIKVDFKARLLTLDI